MKVAAKILLVLAAVVALCAGLPDSIFYLNTGSFPLRRPLRLPTSATMDEVRERFGPPHSVKEYDNGRVIWYYDHDAFGVCYTAVEFNSRGKSTGTWS